MFFPPVQDIFQLDMVSVLVSLVVSLPCLLLLDSLPPRLPTGQGLGEYRRHFPDFSAPGPHKKIRQSADICTYLPAAAKPVLWIHEILVRIRIRIRGSIPLTNDPDLDSEPDPAIFVNDL